MSNIIKIKTKATTGAGVELAVNEIAYNSADMALWIGTSGGNKQITMDPDDIATKDYVESLVSGLDVKPSVKYAAASPLNPSFGPDDTKFIAEGNGALFVDGNTPGAGDRILLMGELDGEYNGIWEVVSAGGVSSRYELKRPADFEDGKVSKGAYCFVEGGNTNAGKGYVLTTDNPITVNTTELVFSQFSGGASVEDTAVDGHSAIAISSNWAYDHSGADQNVHGAGEGETLLNSGSDIDGGTWESE